MSTWLCTITPYKPTRIRPSKLDTNIWIATKLSETPEQSNKTLPFWGENSPVPISYRMPRITCEPQLPIPQNVEHVKTSNTKHFQIPWSTMCNKQDPIWVHNLSCWVFIHSTENDDKDPSSFKQPQFSDSDQSKSPLKHPRPFAVIVFGLCHHPRLSLTSSTSQL